MTRLIVPEMSCGHCKAAIERAIKTVDANAVTNVNLATRQVDIASQASPEALMAALLAEGYPATVLT
jgi:copper chaperone